MSKLIWKQAEGWIEYNPSQNHPCYEEWIKLKEKENEDESKKHID